MFIILLGFQFVVAATGARHGAIIAVGAILFSGRKTQFGAPNIV
jgi:hypothetical protein